MKNRSMHQRVQTATPQQRLHVRHQEIILKQIKTLQVLEQLDVKSRSTHRPFVHSSGRKSKSNPRDKHYSSILQYQLAQIEKIRGKSSKPKFSLQEDQKKIYIEGWAHFGEKVQKKTEVQLKTIRKKASFIINKSAAPNICIINGVNKIDQFTESCVAEQKIKNIWKIVVGNEVEENKYFRILDLNKDIRNSVVLGNAYKLCLHSKNYKSSTEEDLKGQKFKSLVYINQNAKKLTKKKKEALLTNNFLIE